MRTIFLLLIYSIGIGVITAQSYVPFPDSNAYWNDLNHYQGICDPPDYCQITHFINGDTILNDKLYHKIYSDDGSSNWCDAGLREDDKKIYIYYFTSSCSQEQLLYDFNLNVGDSALMISHWQCDSMVYRHIISVDSILLEDMSYRRRIIFVNGPVWIEGIGSPGGLFYNWWYDVACICFRTTVCFEHNNVILYKDESIVPCFNNVIVSYNDLSTSTNLLEVFPNPVMQDASIIFSSEKYFIMEIEIYDILGKREMVIKNQNEKKIALPGKDFKAGFYIYRVSFLNQKQTLGKLIIE